MLGIQRRYKPTRSGLWLPEYGVEDLYPPVAMMALQQQMLISQKQGGGASGPPVLDTVVTSDSASLSALNTNWSAGGGNQITVGGGSLRALYFAGTFVSTANNVVGLTATWQGSSMTSLFTPVDEGSSDHVHCFILRLVNPGSGTGTFTASVSSGTVDAIGGYLISFTNVNQSTPDGTPVTGTGTSAAPSVTVASNSTGIVLDILAWDTGNAVMGGGTGRVQRVNVTSNTNAAGSSLPGVASSVMNWTTNNEPWAMGAVSVIGN